MSERLTRDEAQRLVQAVKDAPDLDAWFVAMIEYTAARHIGYFVQAELERARRTFILAPTETG